MARTSRKLNTFVPVSNEILKIGIYVRLSNENNGGISETCVENQLQYLERFVKRLENACIVDVFIDNGQTGTNFNRPEWQRLMEMAVRGEINCIVVKDLSRFARSYIDAGDYLERIFPELGIRLIAVNDNYDSYNILFPEKDIMASFRNLANDYYSKDISRKVLSSFEAKKNNGEFIGSKAPYGYVLINNHFVIDPPAAKVVKRIFEMRKSGRSFYEIAGVLNKEGIPSPSKYAMENGYRKYKESKVILWQPQAVSRIVYNQVYVGDMITGKYNWSVYSMQPKGKRNDTQWQITSGTHEAIIDRKTFEEINQAGEKNKRVWKEKQEKAVSYENVLKDILVCGKCGHKLRREKDVRNGKLRYRYYCASGYLYSESECSPFFMVDYKVFEIILEQIRIQIDLAVQMEDVLLRLKKTGIFQQYVVRNGILWNRCERN